MRPARRFNLDQPPNPPRPDTSYEHRRRRREQARLGEPQRSGSRAVRGRLNRRLAHVRTCSSAASTEASHATVHLEDKQDACQREKPAPELRFGKGSTNVGTVCRVLPEQSPGFPQLPRCAFNLERHAESDQASWLGISRIPPFARHDETRILSGLALGRRGVARRCDVARLSAHRRAFDHSIHT